VAFWLKQLYPLSRSGCSAVWLARFVRDEEVVGSNPTSPTIIAEHYMRIFLALLLVTFHLSTSYAQSSKALERAFFEAAADGKNAELLAIVAKGVDIKTKDESGWNALMTAALHGNIETVKMLMEKGLDVNEKRDSDAGTAVMASSVNGQLEMTKFLVEKGANINAKDHVGTTPLMFACVKSRLQIIKYLLEKGADVNARDDRHYTALMMAVRWADAECVKAILDKKPEVRAKNVDNKTAIDIAVEGGNKSILALLDPSSSAQKKKKK
jgi:ankyrin repeat protein